MRQNAFRRIRAMVLSNEPKGASSSDDSFETVESRQREPTSKFPSGVSVKDLRSR